MVSAFGVVFSFDIQHAFYTNKVCEDFNIVPLPATAARLQSHQSVFRFNGNTGTLLQKFASGSTPPVLLPFETGLSLEFGIYLNSSHLFSITPDVDTDPDAGFPTSPYKALLFTNTDDTFVASPLPPPEFSRQEISICGTVIAHRIVTALAVTVKLENEAGDILSSESYEAGSDNTELQFNLQSYGPGLYILTETTGSGSTSYSYYSDEQATYEKPFGILRITIPDVSPYLFSGNEKYRISFSASDSIWRYFIVAPNLSASDISSLSIRDQGRMGMAQIQFSNVDLTVSPDPVATTLATTPGKVALFVSDSPVTWQQAVRKQIELRKGSTTIIANLANPDSRKPGSDIIIHV